MAPDDASDRYMPPAPGGPSAQSAPPPRRAGDGPAGRHVFVYGTLRRGGSNDINRLMPAPQWCGLASVAGDLYHLGAYPGIVLGGTGRVVGEVYWISPALEAVVDAIEDITPAAHDEYIKADVTLALQGRSVECLVYALQHGRPPGASRIAGGNWSALPL